jgi:hypothetical protein
LSESRNDLLTHFWRVMFVGPPPLKCTLERSDRKTTSLKALAWENDIQNFNNVSTDMLGHEGGVARVGRQADWLGCKIAQIAHYVETFECKRRISFTKDHVPKGQRKWKRRETLACKRWFCFLGSPPCVWEGASLDWLFVGVSILPKHLSYPQKPDPFPFLHALEGLRLRLNECGLASFIERTRVAFTLFLSIPLFFTVKIPSLSLARTLLLASRAWARWWSANGGKYFYLAYIIEGLPGRGPLSDPTKFTIT